MNASLSSAASEATGPAVATPSTFGGRVARFYCMHLSALVTIIIYFVLHARLGELPNGLRSALLVAFIVQTAYIVLARWQGEHKQFDFGLWIMFAIGLAGELLGLAAVHALFKTYSPALVFLTFGLTAVLPPLFGREWFTAYFVRRTVPGWQQKLPVTARVARLMAFFWTAIFFVSAALCAYAPTDFWFTFVVPNSLVFLVGMSANVWLPLLYLRMFPPETPSSAEALILGMPMAFDRRAARGIRAQIQYRVTGTDAARYWVRIENGRCASAEGDAPSPDLVVHTPADVWVRIAHGELDGGEALAAGLYRVEGDGTLLDALRTWFPQGSGSKS
jgi:putative sterol carrier protein